MERRGKETENRLEDLVPVLQKCRLFGDLPEEDIRRSLLPLGVLRTFSRGGEIIAPQRRIDWFAVVLEGRVQILNLFANGSSSLMDILKPSYVLGADLICTESRVSPYYAVADSPCRIFAFPSDVLLAEGALPDPIRARIWQRLITLLSHENMRKHYRLAILSQHGLRDRILVYLTMQAGKKGSGSFRIPFSRDEMADFLCVNRSALSHELSRMEREGLIRFHKNQFTLLLAGKDRSNWSGEK